MQELEDILLAREQRREFKLLDIHSDVARAAIDHQRLARRNSYLRNHELKTICLLCRKRRRKPQQNEVITGEDTQSIVNVGPDGYLLDERVALRFGLRIFFLFVT